MARALVEDIDEFKAFLAAQPLCQWAAQKQREVAAGLHEDKRRKGLHPPTGGNNNADLAAALSSMA